MLVDLIAWFLYLLDLIADVHSYFKFVNPSDYKLNIHKKIIQNIRLFFKDYAEMPKVVRCIL